MLSWVVWATGKAGWYFFAWGPQFLICLGLGYLCARRTGGDLLNWLVAAFLASLIPIGGVVVMLAVWWRAGDGDGGSRPARNSQERSSCAPDADTDGAGAGTAS